MEKEVIRAGVPETGGPFNLCIRHGGMLYISGLPPFEEEYCARLFLGSGVVDAGLGSVPAEPL